MGYALVAEITKLAVDGTMNAFKAKELAQGVLGFGKRGMEQSELLGNIRGVMRELLAGGDNIEEVSRAIRRFSGEIVPGLAQPFVTFKELYEDYGAFLEIPGAIEEAKPRDVRESPFLGPTMKKLPGISRLLPERELAAQAETPARVSPTLPGTDFPISRQLGGASGIEISVAKAELTQMGFTETEIRGPGTGIPEAVRLVGLDVPE